MTDRYFFVEGKCEYNLVKALQLPPAAILPGRTWIYNAVQEIIPSSSILSRIKPDSQIVLIFDTDTLDNISILESNIRNIRRCCRNPQIVLIPQNRNIEDELKCCFTYVYMMKMAG